MRVQVFNPPAVGETWEQNKIAEFNQIISLDYEEFFNGIGEFSLVLPSSDISIGLLAPYQYIYVKNHSLIIMGITSDETSGTTTIIGYDVKVLLSLRLTEYGETNIAGATGYDPKTGTTEEIIKYYINKNCVMPTNTDRKIPKLSIATNIGRGIASDKYLARLETVSDVAQKLCANANIGYTMGINFTTNTIDFDVATPTNSEYVFDANRQTLTTASRKVDISSYKNTYYAENQDGATTIVNKDTSPAIGIARNEVYMQLNCTLSEVEQYAKREASGYIRTDTIEGTTADNSDYGSKYKLGDIVYAKVNEKLITSLISSVKFSYNSSGDTVAISIGEEAPRILNAIANIGKATQGSQRQIPPATAYNAWNSANGKNKQYKSTSAPTVADVGTLTNDVWWQVDGSENIIGQWSWNGTTWIPQQLNHQVISSLDLGKATVGYLLADKVRLENFSTLSGNVQITNDGKIKAIGGEFTDVTATGKLKTEKTSGGTFTEFVAVEANFVEIRGEYAGSLAYTTQFKRDGLYYKNGSNPTTKITSWEDLDFKATGTYIGDGATTPPREIAVPKAKTTSKVFIKIKDSANVSWITSQCISGAFRVSAGGTFPTNTSGTTYEYLVIY